MLVQAPSLFSTRNYLNGYCVISLAPDRSRVQAMFRTYFENRRAFGPGENVVARGLFYPNDESKTYWSDQPLGINLRKYRRWLTEVALTSEKLRPGGGQRRVARGRRAVDREGAAPAAPETQRSAPDR